jgi:hypothetical protein
MVVGERLWVCDPAYKRGRPAMIDALTAEGLRLHFERVAEPHFYIEEPHRQEHLFSPGERMLIATYRSKERLMVRVLEARANEYLVRSEEGSMSAPLRHP